MTETHKIAVFEGDGIGPEIMRPTIKILDGLASLLGTFRFDFNVAPAGANHYARTGMSLPGESLATARSADAILLSAMGDPDIRYPDGTEISPQIELRQQLGLIAGLRPVRIAPGQTTPLNLPSGTSVDFVIIRESTEGLFASMGKGVVTESRAEETMVITRDVSEFLFRTAFRLAISRKAKGLGPGRVTSVDKANVFRSFAFFRSIFREQATHFPDISADAAYVDATALKMVQKPWDLDVLVTENMFGDILSDLGAGLMGGLGLAPSADIGARHAVFQPCHGSAPDIAGQDIANPMAMILSAAMMLDWLGERKNDPALVDAGSILQQAVETVIAEKRALTPDLGGSSTTDDVSNAVLDALPAAVSAMHESTPAQHSI